MRIIAATNVDLDQAVKEGKFRRDLYYRLSVLTIKLPPLRDRGEDPVIMAKYFVERYSKELGKNIKGLTADALEVIRDHPWPGNVRELINTIRKAVVLTDKEFIDVEDLDLKVKCNPQGSGNGEDILNLKRNIEDLREDCLKKHSYSQKGIYQKLQRCLELADQKFIN